MITNCTWFIFSRGILKNIHKFIFNLKKIWI